MFLNKSEQKKRLFDVLLETGKIKPDSSSGLADLSNQDLESRLKSENMVSTEDINRAYGLVYDLPFITLRERNIDPEVLQSIPKDLAQKYNIISYEFFNNTLKIAIADPGKLSSDLEAVLTQLKTKKNINIDLAITMPDELPALLEKYPQSVSPQPPQSEEKEATIETESQPSVPKVAETQVNIPVVNKSTPATPATTPPPAPQHKTIDLSAVKIPYEVISKFPEDIARKYQMVVFEAPHPTFIKVAVADPDDKKVKEILEFVRDKNDIAIEEYQTTPGQIHMAMRYYQPAESAPSPVASPAPPKEPPKPQLQESPPRQFMPKPEAPKNAPLAAAPPPPPEEHNTLPQSPVVPIVKKEEEKVPEVISKIKPVQPVVNQAEKDIDSFLGQEVKEVGDLQAIAETEHVPKIVAASIALAVRRNASDIHIEPEEGTLRIRFRIDGILRDIIKLPLEEQPAIISRIKILANLKIDESRVPQDGRFDCSTNGHLIDLRISTLPTVHGEKTAMRILDKSLKMYTMEELGLTGKGLKILMDNIDKPYGVVLSTGPTGSGKSTSLYAILNRISTSSVNIVTLEDPVEYEIPGINQCQIKPRIGFTFANGLRSVLRQDPNIIMVGEIRDAETASLATHAALTGHLVLSSLHTNDAAGALPRLINMGVEPFLITSSINCIIGQRLVRRLCQKCKRPAHIPTPVFEEIQKELAPFNFPKPYQFFEGKGCEECDQGYKGRIGIFEVLPMSDGIEAAAIARKPTSEIKAEAIKEGMVTMKQDGLIKALKGMTSVNEVLRVVSI